MGIDRHTSYASVLFIVIEGILVMRDAFLLLLVGAAVHKWCVKMRLTDFGVSLRIASNQLNAKITKTNGVFGEILEI